MRRLVRTLVLTAVATGFLGSVGIAAQAAGKVSCEVTKEGKKEVVKVATAEECTRMGGKVVTTTKK